MSVSRVAVTLYRSLLRVKRDYSSVRVPLPALPLPPEYSPTPHSRAQWGNADTTLGCISKRKHCVTAQLRALVDREGQTTTKVPDPLDVGFKILRQLRTRLSLLLEAEEETVEALGAWHDLLLKYECRPADTLTAMEAVEEGAMLFHRLMQPPASHYVLEEEAEAAAAKTEEDLRKTAERLDDLAELVRARRPELYNSDGRLKAHHWASFSSRSEAYMQCLEDVRQVLFKTEGLKAAYPEYLYDKTSNVLLAEVLESGKGIPIALATLTMCIARRVGLPMSGSAVFLMARSTVGSTHFASAAPSLEGEESKLPAHLATRLMTMALSQQAATGPELAMCILQVDPTSCSPQCLFEGDAIESQISTGTAQKSKREVQASHLVYVDPFNHLGGVISEEDCHQLALGLGHAVAQADVRSAASVSQWYASMARVAVQVHTRRGESDSSAFWLRVLLALDPDTPEWNDMQK